MSDETSTQLSNFPEVSNKLPRAKPGSGLSRTERRYVKGSHESIKRLKKNGFDPIDELVSKYRRLEKELDYYEDWRANRITPLTATGKIKAYNDNASIVHLNIYDKLLKVGEALLRYAYGRVPEGLNLSANNAKPLIINLSEDKQSYEVIVNDQEEEND